MLDNLIINGNIKTNSTSKTKKTKEIKKNRMEKGSRALYLGVNPHSKGLIFSRSNTNFLFKDTPKINKTQIKIKITISLTSSKYIF